MPSQNNVFTFDEVLTMAHEAKGPVSVLLGNGFSVGAHEGFKYQTLYEEACKEGLSERAKGLFEHYGTANFEDILRRLDEGVWLADHYGLGTSSKGPTMQEDHEGIKDALTKVIARVHPAARNYVADNTLLACAQFLERFGAVFTTNYDILIYWAFLAKDPPVLRDAFFEEGDGYRVFEVPNSTGRTIHYLHGALHVYTVDGEVRKRTWDGKTVLVDKIREGMDKSEYPLIVTEGTATQKMVRIEASGYLSWCLQEFQVASGTMLLYGSSLSDQDEHLWKAIVDNRFLDRLAVGVHGDPESASSMALMARAKKLQERRHALCLIKPVFKELDLWYFESDTAHVWDAPEPKVENLVI